MKGCVSSVNKIIVSVLFSTFPASPVRKKKKNYIVTLVWHCLLNLFSIALSTLPLHLLTSCKTTSRTVTFHTVTSCFAGSIFLVWFWFLYGVLFCCLVGVFLTEKMQSFLLSCSVCSVANTTAYSARKKRCCPCQTGMTSDVASSAAS